MRWLKGVKRVYENQKLRPFKANYRQKNYSSDRAALLKFRKSTIKIWNQSGWFVSFKTSEFSMLPTQARRTIGQIGLKFASEIRFDAKNLSRKF